MNKAIAAVITVVVLLIACIVFYSQLFFTVDASEIAVFQAPFTGTLTVHSTPGTYSRLGSTVTTYKKRDLFPFEYKPPFNCRVVGSQQGQPTQVCDVNPDDHSIQVRFNDGGHANIGGNLSWEMPSDDAHVILLHTYFRSQENVDRQLVRNAITAALFQTSPQMSSTESYAARRNEFLQLFADQLENGTYKTENVQAKLPDPITGELKTVTVAKIVLDAKGVPVRAEASQMKQFGINILPPTISAMVYDPEVEHQIQQQRDNIMAIQTAQAQAKKAEQAAITAAKNGEAAAAVAKWEQEVVKAREVTLADQQAQVAKIQADKEKNVAEIAAQRESSVQTTNAQRDLQVQTLKAQTAEQYKTEQIKMGEGDSERRKLILAADGALQSKLDTYLEAQKVWANAFANYKGNIVPQFVAGQKDGGTGSTNGALDFMTIMGMKAAKDLAFDPSVQLRQAPAAR